MRILATEGKTRPDGGQERCLLEVCEGLAARGHEVRVLYREGGAFLPAYERLARSVVQVPRFVFDPRHSLRSGVELLHSLTAGLRQPRDLTYMNDYQHALFGATMAYVTRTPLTCHLYLLPPERYASQLRVGLSRVTRFIACSDHVRKSFVRSGLPAERIDLVYIGIDPERYVPAAPKDQTRIRMELGIPTDSFVVMFAGRLDPQKGLDVLLKAFARFQVGIDSHLLVAGSPVWHANDAAADAYVDSLKEMTVPGTVTWLPSQLDVVPLYQAADLVVFPSIWQEPLGRITLEAMACGRPVVGSRVGGIPEVLTGRFSDLLFEPGDVADLLEKMKLAYELIGSDPNLGTECRQHITSRFNLNTTIDGIEATFAHSLGS